MTIFRSETSPRKRRRVGPWLIGIAIVILLLVGGIMLRARSFDPVLPPPLVASASIPLTLPDGHRAMLGDLLKSDRPTVINLWASWCLPCRREAPAILELRQRFGKRINLLYLNVRDTASREDLNQYLSEVGLPTDNYARLEDSKIAALTGASDNLVPRTLGYDRTGVPLAVSTGYKPLGIARVAGLLEP